MKSQSSLKHVDIAAWTFTWPTHVFSYSSWSLICSHEHTLNSDLFSKSSRASAQQIQSDQLTEATNKNTCFVVTKSIEYRRTTEFVNSVSNFTRHRKCVRLKVLRVSSAFLLLLTDQRRYWSETRKRWWTDSETKDKFLRRIKRYLMASLPGRWKILYLSSWSIQYCNLTR